MLCSALQGANFDGENLSDATSNASELVQLDCNVALAYVLNDESGPYAEGTFISDAERCGDLLANEAHHGEAHKWLVVTWHKLEAAAAQSAVVRMAAWATRVKANKCAHSEYCNS